MSIWGGSGSPFEAIEILDSELSRAALKLGVLRLAMAEGLESLAGCNGHHALGFSTLEGYALERCERSARWVQASRCLARKLARLPVVRRALVCGEIGFCMAQTISAVPGLDRAEERTTGDEAWWIAEGRRRTVREVRKLVHEMAGSAQRFVVSEEAPRGQEGCHVEARVGLTVTVDREDEWLFEHARVLAKHVVGVPAEETLEALLGEGTTSLLPHVDRSAVVPFDETLDEAAPQRAWEKELARFRAEAEEHCEAGLCESAETRGAAYVHEAELEWDGDAESIDAGLREVATELARRDLLLGEVAEAFWTADGWRRLGYATESQYARERLGMSLSAVKAKRALARRARRLPRLHEAVTTGELGYEAARLVASVASRETTDAWVDRARERTVKHLREEVDAAELLGRTGVDSTMAPPTMATMDALAELERRIVTGHAFQSHESQMFAPEEHAVRGDAPTGEGCATRVPAQHLRWRGRVPLHFQVTPETRRHYRWLELLYLRHGPRAGSFIRYLCLSFIRVWRRRPPFDREYAHIYERDAFRCTSPVCSRRDVTPHHLVFRSHGGDDSEENLATLCVWCHLEGVHGGALTVAPPASSMQWRIGRQAHTVIDGRRRTRVPSFAARAATWRSTTGRCG